MINNISFGSTYRVNLNGNSWGKLDEFQKLQGEIANCDNNMAVYSNWQDDNVYQTAVIDDKFDEFTETFLKSRNIKFSKFKKSDLSNVDSILNRMVVPNEKYPNERYIGYPIRINTKKFDKVFQKSDVYVDKNDRAENPERYESFEKYIQSVEPIDTPEVYIRECNNAPVIDFQDGIHRYAYLRNMGVKNIPVAMDSESLCVAQKYNLV